MERGTLAKNCGGGLREGSLGKPDVTTFQNGLRMAREKKSDPIRDFDQLESGGGWRGLASQGKHKEALVKIEGMLEANPAQKWNSSLDRHMLAFHGLQCAGMAGVEGKQVETLTRASISPLPGSWNNYVNMTRDFILGDREGFDRCVRQMDAPPTRVGSSMIRNFGVKKYREMYMEVVQEMQQPPRS